VFELIVFKSPFIPRFGFSVLSFIIALEGFATND
jgi:hypothetical protein